MKTLDELKDVPKACEVCEHLGQDTPAVSWVRYDKRGIKRGIKRTWYLCAKHARAEYERCIAANETITTGAIYAGVDWQ
jgi:hypothetical protein